jgi:hypothetical protein
MRLRVTDDGNFLQIVNCTQLESEQLESSFTKKPDNWFILKKKTPHWDGDIKFVDRYNRIPLGLWGEVKELGQKFNFPTHIEDPNGFIIDKNYNPDDYEKWVVDFFEHSEITPRYYQNESVKRALKYVNCTQEISTSAGKTLIGYLFFRYLLDRKKIKKLLYIVPNTDLVGQSEDKFYQYEEKVGIKDPEWKSVCIFGGSDRRGEKEANIVFGTYQSLTKKGLEYFSEFDAVFVDECLHPDTEILMSDFSKKKIKDIKEGELVWTINEKTKSWEIRPVDFVYRNLSKGNQMYEIEMEDGSILKITGNHKVFTKDYIWKRVDELDEKDEIISFNMLNI